MNPLVAYYNDLRKLGGARRGDFTLNDLRRFYQRAAKFSDADRAALEAAFTSFSNATVCCPKCGSNGSHGSNVHHRFGKLRFTCIKCHSTFNATEVQS